MQESQRSLSSGHQEIFNDDDETAFDCEGSGLFLQEECVSSLSLRVIGTTFDVVLESVVEKETSVTPPLLLLCCFLR